MRQTARPGLIIIVLAIVCFALMLLLLDNESTTGYIAMTKRMSLQTEIAWHETQENTIRKTHADIYEGRSRALAKFLTDHPEYRSFNGLKELSELSHTDYLMLFDKDGQETVSSNSYVGFRVGTNISEDYRAVLLGYPSAAVGPSPDPYTNEMQFGTATLLTDKDGHPDGFLLSVVSADSLYKELESVNLQNTVNNFAVQKGCYAAVVDGESKVFLAHTDPAMVGQYAELYLEDKVLGVSFEGFTDYQDESMYISAITENGKDLLFMAPQIPDTESQVILAVMLIVVSLVFALVFYPRACALCVDAMEETGSRLPDKENPLLIFAKGLVVFFTLLAVIAFISAEKGYWSSFDFVFSHHWSKGFHLFSLWAALFIGSITMFVMFSLRGLLGTLEEHLSLRSKTITRLAMSVVNYSCSIFLVFYILNLLGVNTATLLASAGIISIAVGMGAQSMASDILAGFFMMLEGSIHVGDYVSVGGMTGYVTDMGIRTTEITDEKDNVVILNNSHVSNVVNMSRNHPEKNGEAVLKKATDQ
jgi:small conductance mechanosensitive channel